MSTKNYFKDLREAFKAHLLSTSPIEKDTIIDGISVLELESKTCNLIATYINHKGDISKISKHLADSGSIDNYLDLIKLSQSKLKMVASDMPKEQEEYINHICDICNKILEAQNKQNNFNSGQTADLSEELAEFRNTLNQKHAE